MRKFFFSRPLKKDLKIEIHNLKEKLQRNKKKKKKTQNEKNHKKLE